jgi:hypothetical protein
VKIKEEAFPAGGTIYNGLSYVFVGDLHGSWEGRIDDMRFYETVLTDKGVEELFKQ